MADVVIRDTRKVPALDPGRRGKMDRIVTFSTEDNAVLLVTLPEESYSDAALHAAIKKELDERGKLVGKKLTV
jgi:hypothetical protein